MKFFNELFLLSFLGISVSISAQKYNTVKIGMCTDVHLSTMHDSEYRITTFIDAMKKEKPDFIIELGDFCTPEPKYAKYFDIWKSFPGEKYHVIGNHEMDGGTENARLLQQHPFFMLLAITKWTAALRLKRHWNTGT